MRNTARKPEQQDIYRIGYLVKLFRSGRKSRQFINLLIPTIVRASFCGLGWLLSAKVFENL